MNSFIARKSHQTETPVKGMHATAVAYATKHLVRLGRYGEGHGAKTGYYYIAGLPQAQSMEPTAKSAIAMMKRHGFK